MHFPLFLSLHLYVDGLAAMGADEGCALLGVFIMCKL